MYNREEVWDDVMFYTGIKHLADFCENCIHFMKNVYKYKSFLWNDYWWDDHYVFRMLREKLKEDIKMYRGFGCHQNVDNQIRQMEICRILLDRIVADDYLQNALFFFEKQYPDWGDMCLSNSPEFDEKWLSRCTQRADRQKQQDIDYLFKFMARHISFWWD